MERYKKFRVTSSYGWVDMKGADSIERSALPIALQVAFEEPGEYAVQRVRTGGIMVSVVPYDSIRIPAEYRDSGGGICRKLCRLVGYTAKRPAVIRMRIRRIK